MELLVHIINRFSRIRVGTDLMIIEGTMTDPKRTGLVSNPVIPPPINNPEPNKRKALDSDEEKENGSASEKEESPKKKKKITEEVTLPCMI